MAGKKTANKKTDSPEEAAEKAGGQGMAAGKAGSQGKPAEKTGGQGMAAGKAAGKAAGASLAGWKIVAEDEAERKLRRRANRIRKAMLQDLWARGLTAAPVPGRKSAGRSAGGGSYGADAWTGSSGDGDKDRGAIYADMVEDYVALWITRERLEADIAERGVTVFDEKRGLPVENCSVSARVRVSKQMTTIMQTLGYKDQAIKARRPEGDADDEL